MTAELDATVRGHLLEVASRRGVTVDELLTGPPVLDPRGAVMDEAEAVAYRADLATRILRYEATGEFDLRRLPAPHADVAAWVQWIIDRESRPAAPGEEAPSLVLMGNVGCGKTSQLLTIVRDLALHAAGRNRGFRWRFTTHRAFSSVMRGQTKASPDALFEQLKTYDLVGFDDIGDIEASDWTLAKLAELINHRYHYGMTTVYTTNLPYRRDDAVRQVEQEEGARISVLRDLVDDRALSRLEAGWTLVLPDIDYRARRGRVIVG